MLILIKKNWKILFLLVVFFLIGLSFRIYKLDERGLATDETEKMLAGKNYLKFRFFEDVEHPMLLKEMCAMSIFILGESETSLRLPNAIFGALTCIPIYLVGMHLYNKKVGILSALLWAINISAISYNRTAKEDTLMVFFGLLFMYYALKIKENSKYYLHAGIFLGLAFASKYVCLPLVFFWLFYTYLKLRTNTSKSKFFKFKIWIKRAILPFSITFLTLNPIFLFPKYWQELSNFFSIRYSDHSGYFFMGNLRESLPIYFIPLYILVKTPPILLGFFIIGIVFMALRLNKSDKFIFLWCISITSAFSLPYWISRFTRYIMPILPGIVISTAIGLIVVPEYLSKNFIKKSSKNLDKFKIICILTIIIFLTHPFFILMNHTPYYSLYVNEIGGDDKKEGYYFPHCSYYDWGMREAVFYLNENAKNGSSIAAIEDEVLYYYENKSFIYCSIQTLPENISSWKVKYNISYAVVQKYRIYYENIDKIKKLENNYKAIEVIKVNGKEVIQIYKI